MLQCPSLWSPSITLCKHRMDLELVRTRQKPLEQRIVVKSQQWTDNARSIRTRPSHTSVVFPNILGYTDRCHKSERVILDVNHSRSCFTLIASRTTNRPTIATNARTTSCFSKSFCHWCGDRTPKLTPLEKKPVSKMPVWKYLCHMNLTNLHRENRVFARKHHVSYAKCGRHMTHII